MKAQKLFLNLIVLVILFLFAKEGVQIVTFLATGGKGGEFIHFTSLYETPYLADAMMGILLELVSNLLALASLAFLPIYLVTFFVINRQLFRRLIK